jgi:diketogulonate reductase-like aldo/keto reductase
MAAEQKTALNNGVWIDRLGYGTARIPPPETAVLCYRALEAGFRHIDTAALYGNEQGVGEAVRKYTAAGLASREEIFVTTKVYNHNHGYHQALRAFEDSARLLGLDYIDLYLIHWPQPKRALFVETYRALERLYQEGRVRAVGVSNFLPEHLEELLEHTEIVPAVNQIELHPWFQQAHLRKFNAAHGIRTVAWSPLARGATLSDPIVVNLARDLDKTPAQVILRWHLQLGNIAIPKATGPRIQENFRVWDFTLDNAAMERLAGLDHRDGRIGSHPDQIN